MSEKHNNVEEDVGCIVGAVVQLKPDAEIAVGQQVAACEGVEVHTQDEQLRLVITMEAKTSKAALKLTEHIQNLNGVLSVTPVYQHCEENQQHEGGWKWR